MAPAINLLNVPAWTEQGAGPENNGGSIAAPNNAVNGATEVLLAHPTTANMVFAGTVAGGVWRTADITGGGDPANINWAPLTDNNESLYVGAMAFDPSAANTLYYGTGSYSNTFRNQPSQGAIGLFRTTNDSAATLAWENLGRSTFSGLSIRRISISPTNSDQILVAADNGTSGGLFIDVAGTGAQQWTDLTDGVVLPNVRASDVLHDPNHANTYYAALPGAGVYRTDNNGATWNRIDNLNTAITGIGASGDIEMALHNTGSLTVLYVGVVSNAGVLTGVFRYAEDGVDNNGAGGVDDFSETTWSAIGVAPAIHNGAQGFNNFAITADPTDANIVYVSGDRPPNIFRGDAGGGTWTSLSNTAAVSNTRPHADSRALYFRNTTTLMEADDGGIYELTNPKAPVGGADRWTSLVGNIRAIEFHSIAYDTNANLIFGGAQDNSSLIQTATNSLTWNSFGGGDGSTQSYSVPGNLRYSLQNNFGSLARNGTQSQLRAPAGVANFDGLENTSGGNDDRAFATGGSFESLQVLEANRINANDVMIGRRALYTSTNQGDNITTVIGPTGMAGEKGATDRFIGRAVFGGRRAGTDYANIFWVGTGAGRLYLRDQTGAIIDRTAALNTTIPGGGVKEVIVDPDDYTRAFVLKGNRIAFTTNAGANWTEITDNVGGLTGQLDSLALVDPTPGAAGDGTLVAGGLAGVYRYLSPPPAGVCADHTWTQFGLMPNTLVHDLDFIPIDPDANAANGTGLLLAGTFGRGAWTMDNVSAKVTLATTLQVVGDGAGNTMELRQDPNSPAFSITVSDGLGATQSFAKGLFDFVQFQGLAGADTIRIDSNGAAAGGTVDFVTFHVNVDGGGNPGDHLILEDISDTTADQVTVASADIGAATGDSFFAACGDLAYTGLSTLTLDLSDSAAAGDNVRVPSTAAGTATELFGNKGNDVFNISSNAPTNTGNLNGILGKLVIDAGAGAANRLIVSDQAGDANTAVVVSNTKITGFAGPTAGHVDIEYAATGGAFTDGASSDGILLIGSGSAAAGDVFTVQSALAGSTLTIDGKSGNDRLEGPNLNNSWNLTAANAGNIAGVVDSFLSFENLTGGTLRDVFHFNLAGSTSGIIKGGTGNNYLDYSALAGPLTINLATGIVPRVTGGVQQVGSVLGSAGGADTIIGNAAGGVLVGHNGGNTILAGAGRSVIIGGFGLNTLFGGVADDLLINGRTTYDANFATLDAIFGIWQGGLPYLARIAALQAPGPNQLKIGATVFVFPGRNGGVGPRVGRGGAGFESTLVGNGGMNWFITNSFRSVADKKPGEIVTIS